MENKFERTISKILVFFIIVLFVLTIFQRYTDEWIVSLLWYISFIVSWTFMLIYGFDVFLNKNAKGFSIFVAIITSLAFGALSIHGLSAIAMFIRALPTNIVIHSDFFITNNQFIFYSSLLVVYIMQMLNLMLNNTKDIKVAEDKNLTEEEIRQIRDAKLDEIIKDIEENEKNDGLTDEDRQILNSHILNDEDSDGSEIKIYE